MNQSVTVALIGGESGIGVRQLAQQWHSQRQPDPVDPKCWIWPVAVQREIQKFVRALRAHATKPPVLFYRRWVDQWSGGYVFDVFPRVRAGSKDASHIHYDGGELHTYSLPDRGTLTKRLNFEGRRRRNSIGGVEAWWFIDAVRDAISACRSWHSRSTLIFVREVLDGTVEDIEIAAAMDSTVSWLKPLLSVRREKLR